MRFDAVLVMTCMNEQLPSGQVVGVQGKADGRGCTRVSPCNLGGALFSCTLSPSDSVPSKLDRAVQPFSIIPAEANDSRHGGRGETKDGEQRKKRVLDVDRRGSKQKGKGRKHGTA